jgi:hypothetical protein
MPMGITRVADQYGYLNESEARREYLAAHEAEAAAIAEAQRGHGITAGLNDPRRMAYEAAKLAEMGVRRHAGLFQASAEDEQQQQQSAHPDHEYHPQWAGGGWESGLDRPFE